MGLYYAVFATDKPDTLEVLERVRPTLQTYLRSAARHGVHVRLGGPTLAPLGGAMNGTLLVVEADEIDAVMQFIGNDPLHERRSVLASRSTSMGLEPR